MKLLPLLLLCIVGCMTVKGQTRYTLIDSAWRVSVSPAHKTFDRYSDSMDKYECLRKCEEPSNMIWVSYRSSELKYLDSAAKYYYLIPDWYRDYIKSKTDTATNKNTSTCKCQP